VKELIAQFSQKLRTALDILKSQANLKPQKPIDNVVITGLGGSGIGGTIVAELCAPFAKVPIVVNKDYYLPAFVGPNTLLIACSYSGNTEETLSALAIGEDKGAQIACISSGGNLKTRAAEQGYPCLSMEGGNPPRSMFAYSFVFLLYYLESYQITSFDALSEVRSAIQLLEQEEKDILKEAETLASKLQNSTPQLLANAGNLGIAARWRQQLNENAKMLCWEAEVPEMNHNQLVGWEGGNPSFSCLFLRNESDNPRNQKRMEIIKGIIGEKTDQVIEVWSKGNSAIQNSLYLIHLGDWVSYYLSELNDVDIMDIKSIDLLKSELSKIPL
jgi:glucose/mannose-6-phosphate isomerase